MLLVLLLSAANANFLCYNGSALHPNLTNRFNLSSLNPQPCYKTHCGVMVSKSHLFKYSFGCFDNLECSENQCNRVDDGLQCCCNTNSLCNVQDELHHRIWAHYSSNSQTTATSPPGISCSDSSTDSSAELKNVLIVCLGTVVIILIIVIIVMSLILSLRCKKPRKTRKSGTTTNRKVLSVAPMALPSTNEASVTMAPSAVVVRSPGVAPLAGKKVGSGADDSDIEKTAEDRHKENEQTGDIGTLAPTTRDDEAPRYW